jgi:hypothetical protein
LIDYPEVKSKQERLISEWNKRESVFHGVQWRIEDNACSFEFLDILKYTETCFLIHKTHEEIIVKSRSDIFPVLSSLILAVNLRKIDANCIK